MVKRLGLVLAVLLMVAVAIPALAADVKIKGDFNNRFMVYTDHSDWFVPGGDQDGMLSDGSVDETWGEAKYRLWFDATTNDGKVKGVWAFEVGGLEYGTPAPATAGKSTGGSYEGDSINVETRWLYTDFQLPWACEKARVRMGLQPIAINPYFWNETIMGVKLYGSTKGVDYELAWLRPVRDKATDEDDDSEDLDALYGRVNFKPVDGLKTGFFAVYFQGDDDDPSQALRTDAEHYEIKKFANKFEMSILTLGLDGSFAKDNLFCKWDLMYEDGSVDEAAGTDYDLQAWFAHVDLGIKIDALKFTYTFWYASGDDDPTDDDLDGYLSVDVDRTDSLTIMEGGFTDDDYFTERPYILDKGFIMNKLAVDYKASKKLTVGAALMYMMTAEDVEYATYSDDEIGTEINGYLKYKLYDNLEFAINAGYLFAGDALDNWEEKQDGSSDEDIFVSTMRVRYKF